MSRKSQDRTRWRINSRKRWHSGSGWGLVGQSGQLPLKLQQGCLPCDWACEWRRRIRARTITGQAIADVGGKGDAKGVHVGNGEQWDGMFVNKISVQIDKASRGHFGDWARLTRPWAHCQRWSTGRLVWVSSVTSMIVLALHWHVETAPVAVRLRSIVVRFGLSDLERTRGQTHVFIKTLPACLVKKKMQCKSTFQSLCRWKWQTLEKHERRGGFSEDLV